MSHSISYTTIILTRGDTLTVDISIYDSAGNPYTPAEGDSVRFAMKRSCRDPIPLLVKEIPIDTLQLRIEPEDTKQLDFGEYVYDIQLTKANGDVDTFITKAKFKLTEEVH